jgi:hypothetical protein
VYFVRRKGRVKGPLTLEKLRALRDEDRLRMRDEIAESADGPWKRLTEVYVELLDEEETSGEDESGVDDEFWEENATSRRPNGTTKKSAANTAKKPEQPAGLFGGQVKPWQLVAGGMTAAGLAGLALVAGLFLSPVGNQPTNPEEIAANTNDANPPRRPSPQKRPSQRPAQGVAATKPDKDWCPPEEPQPRGGLGSPPGQGRCPPGRRQLRGGRGSPPHQERCHLGAPRKSAT